MPARKNVSRSKELDIVKFVFKSDIPKLKSYLESNPNNDEYKVEDLSFKYGKIERLVQDIDWGYVPETFPITDIKVIYHLDGLDKNEKLLLEKKYKLPKGVLTSKSKADLLVITKDASEIITFKDSSKVAKLGQVSAKIEYGTATIEGGLLPPLPTIKHNVQSYTQTALSYEQFQKIDQNDKKLAYYKKNYPEKWNQYVELCLQNSKEQLIEFSKHILENNQVFIQFILKTLFGNSVIPENYKIIIGDKMISSQSLINFLFNGNYRVFCEEYYTENKFSLIINIQVNSVIYGVTKIEPAFDGSRDNVSQTKGIIFYFQQYSDSGKHIWDFLKDIS